MGQIRPANEITPRGVGQTCSACFNQDVSTQYIDFDAAADRGFVPGSGRSYGDGVAEAVVMDDLVVCEHCIRRAAELLGMTADEELKGRAADLEEEREIIKKERDKAQEYGDRLETLFDSREKPVKIPHRMKPRQRDSEEA